MAYPSQSPEKGGSSAARGLAEKQGRLQSLWLERLRAELPVAADLPGSLLLDALPQWISCLSKAFSSSHPQIELERLERSSREHGRQRADLGFQLQDVLQEVDLLRKLAFQLLEEERPLEPRDRDILLDALEISERIAAESFARRVETFHSGTFFLLPDAPLWIRIGITIGLLGAVTLIQWYAWDFLQPLQYFLFYPALLLVALFGSPVLGIPLAMVLAEVFFAPKALSLSAPEWREVLRVVLFGINAAFFSWVSCLLRKATLDAKAAHLSINQLYQDSETSLAALDALLESAPFGIALLDTESRFLRINQLLAEWNGLPISGHLGKPIYEVGELAKMKGPILRRVIDTGEAMRGIEMAGIPANDPGKLHTFLSTFFPVRNNAGRLIGTGVTILDITEKKRMEAELLREQERCNLALEAGEIGVWEMRLDSPDLTWSKRQFQIFDIDPATTPLTDKVFLSRVHPEDLPRIQEEIERSRNEKRDFRMEFRVKTGAGELRWVQGNGRIFFDAQGRAARLVGTNVDITARKKFEEQLQSAVTQLIQERSLREQFVSALTHDLRTPLTAVRLTAQMCLRDPGDFDRVRARAVRIIDGIDRADRMIRDLLDSNRIRAGQRLPLKTTEFDLAAWAAGALEDLGSVYGDRFRLEAPQELRGRWDREALRRVLENLCSNAVKYGDLHALITVRVAEREGSVELSVHNEGNPIPEEEQKHLFEYLHQAASPQRAGRHGWGIGLTLVRGVAEAHGGKVRVTSDALRGTTFQLSLPRWVEEQVPGSKTA